MTWGSCGCRRGEYLCEEAVRLWRESSRTWEAAYAKGWYGHLPIPANVAAYEIARAAYDDHMDLATNTVTLDDPDDLTLDNGRLTMWAH